MQNKNQNIVEVPTLKLLQQIKNKTLSPKLVSREIRSLMVGNLVLDGWSHPQIAQLLECSEKTIQRDLQNFEDTNKVSPSPEFIRKKVGYFLVAAESQIVALLRIARSPNATNTEKIASEIAVWKIRVDMISKLQSLGFLPSRPTEIVGDVFYHSDKESTPEEMLQMVTAIEESSKEAGILDKEVKTKIKSLKARIEKSEIALEIKQLQDTDNKKEDSDEQENSKRHSSS